MLFFPDRVLQRLKAAWQVRELACSHVKSEQPCACKAACGDGSISRNDGGGSGTAATLPGCGHESSGTPLWSSVLCAAGAPSILVWGSVAMGYGLVAAAVIFAAVVIPSEVAPAWGWVLSFEWGLGIVLVGFWRYLQACYRRGFRAGGFPKAHAVSSDGSKGGLSSASAATAVEVVAPLRQSASAAVAFSVVLVISPWIGDLLGVHSFVGKIVATCLTVVGIAVFATVNCIVLPFQWFAYGQMQAAVTNASY